MLNISKTSVNVSAQIRNKRYSTLETVEKKKSGNVLKKIFYWTFFLIFVIIFLPWTQNIRSTGTVSTLKPNQKPQTVNSVIAGQIKQWYVQEGDFVKQGDTILQISEVKSDYFDDQLLNRTQDQVNLKRQSIDTYSDKIGTQEDRLGILKKQRDLKLSQSKVKLQQAKLYVQNNEIGYKTAKINLKTAQYQYNRMDSLYRLGLKSLTDLEKRNLKLQEVMAKETEARNKWLNSQNEVLSLQLEISNVQAYYQSETNKVQSDRFSTISNKLDTETSLSKLENQYSNYEFRQGLYFITAPTDGFITKTISNGIGETIKEGQEILTLMPKSYDLAVQVFIAPIDLPLVNVGEKVRIQFDGWPAIVFSGWPNASHGTYGGEIYAIDQFISANGKYRILVAPDSSDYPWPEALRFGSGTSTMILLNDVPIWYELWRNINGFPPDFYTSSQKSPSKEY